MKVVAQIDEDRLFDLKVHETEAEKLFESLVLLFAKAFMAERKRPYVWGEDKTEAADYINKSIAANGIVFNSKVPHVWFNGQGTNSCLYWGYHDSKTIHAVYKLLEVGICTPIAK